MLIYRITRLGGLIAATTIMAASGALALDPADGFGQLGIEIWTSNDGLPQNTVQAVLQSSDGFLWFGTQGGLVRFDGVSFQTFSSANCAAFSHDDVQALAETKSGVLWVATYGGGLVRYDHGRITRLEVPGMLTRTSRVRALHVGASGLLWIGTFEEGLYYWDGSRLHDAGLPEEWKDAGITAVVEARDGSVWASTHRGLLHYDGRRWTSVVMPCGKIHQTSALYLDSDSSLWVATPISIVRFHGEDREIIYAPPDHTWD